MKTAVLVATLSIRDNAKLLKQIESGFKRKLYRNKHQPKVLIERQNRYLDYLSNPSFLGVNRVFVLSFENKADRKARKGYLLPNVGTVDYTVMLDGQKCFEQPLKIDQITYDNIQKITIGQGVDYTAACLLDYVYFKEHYKQF